MNEYGECPVCRKKLKLSSRGEVYCPGGCEQLTARAPDWRDNGSEEQIGQGCFIKKKAIIE